MMVVEMMSPTRGGRGRSACLEVFHFIAFVGGGGASNVSMPFGVVYIPVP